MSIYFEWTRDISVGDSVIDSQHKELLEQVNKILNAIVFGVDSEIVKEDIVDFLSRYIKEHFSYEEEFMKKIGYPDLKEHTKKHHNFIKSFNKIKERFDNGEDRDRLLMDVEKYVGNWWVDHIGKEDKKYRVFLAGKKK